MSPGIPKDLDNIVLMALRKEPERRYQSVEELREDIERFVRALPVRASRHTAVYRLRKFLSRRRWEVAAAALAGLLAVAAVGLIWRQGRIAQARFEQLHRLTNSIVFELHDAIQNLPGSTAARKLLVERALEHLKSLEAAARDNRDLQWDVASAYKRIGDVQGEPGRPNLGDAPGSNRELRQGA